MIAMSRLGHLLDLKGVWDNKLLRGREGPRSRAGPKVVEQGGLIFWNTLINHIDVEWDMSLSRAKR